jgi:membrane protease YdiL (CAAX protease family)
MYQQLATLVVILTLLTTLTIGALHLRGSIHDVLLLGKPPYRILGFMLVAIGMIGLTSSAAVILTGMEAAWKHFGNMLASSLLMLIVAISGATYAARQEASRTRAPIDASLLLLALAVTLWGHLWWWGAQRFFGAEESPDYPFRGMTFTHGTLLLLFAPALLAAVAEEVVYRGVLLPWLSERTGSFAAATILVSLIWALAHSAYVVPHGLKELQLLVMGAALSWAWWRYGMLGAIIIHAANNGAAVALTLFAVGR